MSRRERPIWLPQEDRESLFYRAKELDDAGTKLKTKQEDRDTSLATETAKELTDKTLEELETQSKEFEEFLKELRDAVAGLKHKLSDNTAAKERIKEKQSAIEAQKKSVSAGKNCMASSVQPTGKSTTTLHRA